MAKENHLYLMTNERAYITKWLYELLVDFDENFPHPTNRV
jgi:hypothetical protein